MIGEETSGTFRTYHFDYRGSTVALTNINGTITDTFEYDTYGKLTHRTGSTKILFMYNGRDGVVTDDNGLIYMRARYYSPELRRFINSDIIAGEITNAITLNRYAYANGNPVSNVDPSGLLSVWAKLAIGVGAIVIGAAVVAATAATGGAAAAFVGAAVTGLKAAAISGAIGATVGAGSNAIEHRVSTGSWDGATEAAIDGAVDGFADGFMTGGIMAGASQTISGGFKLMAQAGVKTGPSGGIGNTGILSPNRLRNAKEVASIGSKGQKYYDYGGQLFKIGNVKVDVGSKSFLHMHIPQIPVDHIPIGIISSGLYGGLKETITCTRLK